MMTILLIYIWSLMSFEEMTTYANLTAPTHGIYLSLIDIDHKNPQQPAQITLRLFCDDLENALYHFSQKETVSSTFDNTKLTEIESYFVQHFSIKINGNKAGLNLTTCTKEADLYWLTFEIRSSKEWGRIEITADFFMELFPTQSNILSIFHGKEQYYFRLTQNNDSISLNLE